MQEKRFLFLLFSLIIPLKKQICSSAAAHFCTYFFCIKICYIRNRGLSLPACAGAAPSFKTIEGTQFLGIHFFVALIQTANFCQTYLYSTHLFKIMRVHTETATTSACWSLAEGTISIK